MHVVVLWAIELQSLGLLCALRIHLQLRTLSWVGLLRASSLSAAELRLISLGGDQMAVSLIVEGLGVLQIASLRLIG